MTSKTSKRRDFGSIERLHSGRWRIRYRDNDGKVRSRTFDTKIQAVRDLAQIQADLTRGDYVDPRAGAVRLDAYLASWITHRRVRGEPLAPRTAALYRLQLRKHIGPALGHVELRHLTKDRVRRWHEAMTGTDGPGRSTAAKCYRLLRAALATAVEDDLVKINPCVTRGAGEEPRRERPPISLPDLARILAAMEPHWRAVAVISAHVGLRFGELGALQRRHIDVLHGRVLVHQAAAQVPGEGRVVGKTESRASHREVAVPPHVLPVLVKHLDTYVGPEPDALVFTGPKGGALNSGNWHKKVWGPALVAAGVTGVTFQDTRATAATMAGLAGGTLKELMIRLGRSSPDAALRYQRSTADRDTELAAKISAMLLTATTTGTVTPIGTRAVTI
ncbi:site-specific integrase [Modestobacter sp. VKM Ac-2978]|uniref:site-specific integrase n=1 Tax=Modestobacter sp. VKM Ac-2978 TaxID=3004132 RepID=UPI0022AA4261|nr:tyrosine-type recombinase/integrase [Modestobacter sp. VKM Ac-2978]MCZ2848084.1 tyrosine-type recombinase/integrase [Modestobacter sp. VKM Ac-2978]